jgi:CRISPR-associated protein Cas1
MINNITTLCSVKILNELSTRNVLVILCNEKHLPTTLILPISGNYNSLKKIESQIK